MVHGGTQRKNIRADIDHVGSLTLLRRSVSRSPDGGLLHGQSQIACLMVAFHLGDPQVHEFVNTLIGVHDVAGFDVTVDDLRIFDLFERRAHGNKDLKELMF